MRKITTILFMLMAISSFSQSIYDHQGKIRMRYNNGGSPDTLLIQFSGDSVLYDANNPFHKFAGGVIMDSIKLNGVWEKSFVGSQWTTSGSDIYYNTGNVGINTSNPLYNLTVNGQAVIGELVNNVGVGYDFTGGDKGLFDIDNNTYIASLYGNYYRFADSITLNDGILVHKTTKNVGIGKEPIYKLDVNGLIGGSNIETNTTSLSTKLGYEAGLNENESAAKNNTLLGYKAGRALTTQTNNTIVGSNAGLTSTGSGNSIFGISGSSISGEYNSIFGYSVAPNATSVYYSTVIGTYSGYNLTTGDNNTFVGYYSGAGTTTASGNVSIGYYAGYRETGSNKLFIDNQDRTDEATSRTSSLIYGEFNATPSSQLLRVNGNFQSNNFRTDSLTVRIGNKVGYAGNLTNKNVFIGDSTGFGVTANPSSTEWNVAIGYAAGKSITNGGTNNTFVGYRAGNAVTTGYDNTMVGTLAGSQTTGHSNTMLGSDAGTLLTTGTNNIFIGLSAGKRLTTQSNRFIVNNITRASLEQDTTYAIMYGVMAADPLDQTLTLNAKTNLHVHTGLFGRKDPYNTTVADTWQTIKMDSVCADRTTSGFVFNADSTGVIIKFNGYVQFSGHAKLLNNAASQQTASIYFRLRKNSIEQSQFNTAVGRTFPANGAHDLVSATGVIPVSLNDTLSVQLRTNNTNIDLEQVDSGIFTNQSSFCIFLTQVKSIKEFE